MVELAGPPPVGYVLPAEVAALVDGHEAVPVWLNLEGGLTLRLDGDRYLKWSPSSLESERARLEWAGRYLPVPRVLAGEGPWFTTASLNARSAVGVDGMTAARALAAGLRAVHALPVAECPFTWSAEHRGGVDVPPIDRLVVCHGDACVPNTLVDANGEFAAVVDLGRLGLADRWADLAVASMSLSWNFGDGFEQAFFEAYGIERDEARINYYRELWNQPDVTMEL